MTDVKGYVITNPGDVPGDKTVPVTEQHMQWSMEQLREELNAAYAAQVRLSNRNAQLVSTIDVLLWSLARLHQAYQELKGNA